MPQSDYSEVTDTFIDILCLPLSLTSFLYGYCISKITAHLPAMQYADLNPLSTVVGTITGSKPGLGGLRELMLIGNPLHEREMQRNAADYQRSVQRPLYDVTSAHAL